MSVLISVIFARIISRPIESLTKSVQNITQGKYDTKVDVTSKDEIGELGNAFNMMTTKLYQVDERRRKFVSNVSHELRTPMTSMKIVSETLLANSTWEESVYREFLNDIHIEVDRLNNIIDSLLYLVRVEKDDLELDYNMTYVNYLIEWVIKTLKPIADQKNIDLKLVSHNKVQIQLDQEKMQQCLLNIIGNSVKYTPEGGSVTIDLSELKEIVSIKIIDTGIGIPEKDLPFIFDRFYRVDEARARKTGGTGLGLAIAQQIVMLHQGTIEVESQFGIGTTVSIKIPRL
jgi:signal transduction histidine kinase